MYKYEYANYSYTWVYTFLDKQIYFFYNSTYSYANKNINILTLIRKKLMMDYYCEICDKRINGKSKIKHIKSKRHIEISNCERIIVPLGDVDINKIDELYNLYLIEHI